MTDDARSISLAALKLIFGESVGREFGVKFWDGTRVGADNVPFDFVLNQPGALRAALVPPSEVTAGRAFVTGAIDCEGDLEAAVDVMFRAVDVHGAREIAALARLLLRLPKAKLEGVPAGPRFIGRKHSRRRDRLAIGFHYDHPIAFYESFLDPNLIYSCAYWDDGVDDLADAQVAKIDYTLRKLNVRPGERLLDIGCGWGALMERAAKQFGAQVLGITLSRKQHEYAQKRLREAGLTHQARVELRDYRELAGEPLFDKVVSIGMVEHVGYKMLPAYFAAVFDVLRSGGLFLNHGIAEQSPGRPVVTDYGFVTKFVFPDGELVPVSRSNEVAERAGFEVRDVENLREHYARTLRAWIANLERNRAAAVTAAGEHAFRTWRLYMAGSAQGFASGRLGLFQSLLAKPTPAGRVELAPTRRGWYQRRNV